MTKSRRVTAVWVGMAAVICGVLLGACGSGTARHAAGPNAARRPISSAPKATTPVTASPSAPRLSSTVYAFAEPSVTFTGETVTAFAQVVSPTPVPLVVAPVLTSPSISQIGRGRRVSLRFPRTPIRLLSRPTQGPARGAPTPGGDGERAGYEEPDEEQAENRG